MEVRRIACPKPHTLNPKSSTLSPMLPFRIPNSMSSAETTELVEALCARVEARLSGSVLTGGLYSLRV